MREDRGAAEAVDGAIGEGPEPSRDDRSMDPDGLAGLAHAPRGLAIPSEAVANVAEPSPASAFPVLSPPGACRYLQLDGVRQASCHALVPTIALAPRQVELVCLGAAHVDCPRFVGAGGDQPLPVAPSEPPARWGGPDAPDAAPGLADLAPRAPVEIPSVRLGHTVGSLHLRPQARRSRRPRPAMMAAIGALAAAVVLAVGFAALRGGLDPAGRAPAMSIVAVASPSVPTAPSASVLAATASASPAAATATARPTGQPSGSPSPAASPDRLALLTPCPNEPDCYQYRIRRHDNLRGIASFFGVPYQTVLDLNPQIENPSIIHVGDIVILPPPGA